jgi:hypothetical protein
MTGEAQTRLGHSPEAYANLLEYCGGLGRELQVNITHFYARRVHPVDVRQARHVQVLYVATSASDEVQLNVYETENSLVAAAPSGATLESRNCSSIPEILVFIANALLTIYGDVRRPGC